MIHTTHFNQSNLTIVVRAKLDSSPPTSLIPTNGDTLGEIPYIHTYTQYNYSHDITMVTPVLSNSANCKEHLNSYKVSPLNIVARNTPSGLSTLYIYTHYDVIFGSHDASDTPL